MESILVERTWVRATGNWRDSVRLSRLSSGWQLRGKIRNSHPNELVDSAFEGFYQLDLDDQWRTRIATVQLVRGHRSAEMRLRVDDQGRWHDLDERHLVQLDGLEDVDVFLTPATNTIPIRRLTLHVGGSGNVSAALIQMDANDRLFASRLDQHYERLDENTYRYTSFDEAGHAAFSADLTVDDEGVIERYGNQWATASSP